MKKIVSVDFFFFITALFLLTSCNMEINDNRLDLEEYLIVNADAKDPLYTTYAANIERSRLYGDKAYKMNYYSDCMPLHYSSDQAGRMYCIWMINKVVVDKISKYYRKPVVRYSFPDMAIVDYEIFPGIRVSETFLVYSSRLAVVKMSITNTSNLLHWVDLYPVLEISDDSFKAVNYHEKTNGYECYHYETKKRLISNLYADAPYPTDVKDYFTVNFEPYSYGLYSDNLESFYRVIKTDYYADDYKNDSLNFRQEGPCRIATIQGRFWLKPGDSETVVYVRGVQSVEEDFSKLISEAEELERSNLESFFNENLTLFGNIPKLRFDNKEEKMVYLGAFNLVRGCMLPPTGKTNYNFYVFSRHPTWGWGHGHQVLHESLSMLSYVYLDAESARSSQRVYMEQQGEDGLIAYRHGPRGPQTYPHKGMPTTSAPFYSWINWEVYQAVKDTLFLADAYQSGCRYVEWLVKNRDTDNDGLFEWGPYGIIENVRDWYNVIFQVSEDRYLDVDKEDISDELECLDLSLMIVNEMKHLAKMASELGDTRSSDQWNLRAKEIAERINRTMWDEETGFYYHVDKVNHEFEFMSRDLKRQEIIGFLPLWAQVASGEQAERLIVHLTDTSKFWRKYGVPTLAADDDWYSPYIDYCCKWNGPVWLLWDYMVFRGLINYGYTNLARELAGKMMLAVTTQLSVNHNYWESYSPDNTVLDCPSNYIWDCIMARLFIDLANEGHSQ